MGVAVAAVLMAASVAVPLAAWRLPYLRTAPLRFWASHPWTTAFIVCVTAPLAALAMVFQPRSALVVIAMLAIIALQLLIVAVSIVHGLRAAWKRSRRGAALIAVGLLLASVLIAGLNPGSVQVSQWMLAGTWALVGWCVLMAIGAERLEQRYPE
jgi:hypothetical protein